MDWKRIFKKKKPDQFLEVLEVIQTVNNRKMKHLNDCITTICQSAKVPYNPPASYITDYEQKVLERLTGEQAERLKQLVLHSFEEK